MNWLLERQAAIETKLAKRHLTDGALVLYDVTSSLLPGQDLPAGPLRPRPRRQDRPADHRLRPAHRCRRTPRCRCMSIPAIPVIPRPSPTNSRRSQKRFGLSRVVLVGDRGMLTQTQIDVLKKNIRDWAGSRSCGAARSARLLARRPPGQERPGDRTPGGDQLAGLPRRTAGGLLQIRCWPSRRRQKRQELLAATQAELERLATSVKRAAAKPETAAEIGVRAGKIINHYKMSKHFTLTIGDGSLEWARKQDEITREELLDGIYVVRTSEPSERVDGRRRGPLVQATGGWWSRRSDASRGSTCWCDRFTIARPTACGRTSCCACWRTTWSGTCVRCGSRCCSTDEGLTEDRPRRDPVAPAKASESAKLKKKTHTTAGGLPVQRLSDADGSSGYAFAATRV